MAFKQASVLNLVRRTLMLGVLVVAACDSPTKPSTPYAPYPVSLTIAGTLSLTQPGDTGKLTATLTFSDQTSRDVTAEALWSSPLGVVAITAGSVTAVRYGQDNVVARYQIVSATVPARVAPPGAFLIDGVVKSEMGVPLAHALVEFSSRCGTMNVETDDRGMYWLPADGDTTMRISMNNYIPQVKQLVIEADGHVDIELQVVDSPGNVTGTYTLTVTPSPSCKFPSGLFPRQYTARVQDAVGALTVELSGAQFALWSGRAGFTGTRDASTVRFAVNDGFDDHYNFLELLSPPGIWLGYSGTGLGEVHDGQITAAFSGYLDYDSNTPAAAICTASDHRFELVPIDR
jgi:hypothetical protein